MSSSKGRRWRTLFTGFWIVSASTAAMADPVKDEIGALSAQIAAPGAIEIEGQTIKADAFIPRFYESRAFAPAWFGTESEDSLYKELETGLRHGFRPEDFQMTGLAVARAAAAQGGAEAIARYDILATEAAVRLVQFLYFGKVDPQTLDDDWNFARPVVASDPVEILNRHLDAGDFAGLIDRISVTRPQYQWLLAALDRYRTIAAQGGWPLVPDETVLKPGMSDPAVAVLRDRLAAEGALQSGGSPPVAADPAPDPRSLYDPALEADVRAFQNRHGLEADGVIGPATFRALNRTAEERVDQIRLSLERGRWLMQDLEGSFVLVNIAGARTYLVQGDGSFWTTRSITGSAYRKTPVFRDAIQYMEFNPTWTVPNSIFRKDKLAAIRRDPGYLERNNYSVRNRDGAVIPASSVNWTAENPPVTLVQAPGDFNALGRVKFMFPNDYAVYLHDTNDKSLFDRNERNLSSGCVRLERPYELASLLMERDLEWSYARMQSILDSVKTTRIDLPTPMPVLLTYWTAWVEKGEVQFREDIYDRDGRVLTALNG